MTSDVLFDVLKASSIVHSEHGGFYYFVPEHRLEQSVDAWGHIFCTGRIYEIIQGKTVNGQEIIEWLNAGPIQQHIMSLYVSMCECYAYNIVVTYPTPGQYWNWKK